MFTFNNFLGIPVTVVTDSKEAEKAYLEKAQKIPGFKLVSSDAGDAGDVPATQDAITGPKTETKEESP